MKKKKQKKMKVCNCGLIPKKHIHLKNKIIRFEKPPSVISYPYSPLKEMKKKKSVSKKLKAHREFLELCKKYPDTKFIGNCIFNFALLKKGAWIFNSIHPKKSLLQGKRYIVTRNLFKGKFNIKGKI